MADGRVRHRGARAPLVHRRHSGVQGPASAEPGDSTPSSGCAAAAWCSGDESTDISTPEHSPRFAAREAWPSPGGAPEALLGTPPLGDLHCTLPCPLVFQRSLVPDVVAAHTTGGGCLPPDVRAAMPASPPRPGTAEAEGCSFAFTLRLADEYGLGVDLAPPETCSRGLVVWHVLPMGAIESWNKQCLDGTPTHHKAVRPGDVITSVNGCTDCQDMLEQCRSRLLLKITVARAPAPAWQRGVCAWPGGMYGLPAEVYAWSGLLQRPDVFAGAAASLYMLSVGSSAPCACDSERLHSCREMESR